MRTAFCWLLTVPLLGQVVELKGTDLLRESRAVINSNFSVLNSTKAHIGACPDGQFAIATNTSTGVVCQSPVVYSTTDALTEGSANLYFTTARAQAALSGLYEVPLTFSSPFSRTSNTITCPSCLLSSNLTTAGYLVRISAAGTVGQSSLYEDSSGRLGIGTTSPTASLHIVDSSQRGFRIVSGDSTKYTQLVIGRSYAELEFDIVASAGQFASTSAAGDAVAKIGGSLIFAYGTTEIARLRNTGAASFASISLADALPLSSGGTGATTASAARTSLGLGDAARLNIGTTAGTVAAGDDARLSDARTPLAHVHDGADVTTGTTGTGALVRATSPTIDSPNITGTASYGDGTSAGEQRLYELISNGSDYIAWLAPDSLAATTRLRLPSAAPSASQVLAFGAPTDNVSDASWVSLSAFAAASHTHAGDAITSGTVVAARLGLMTGATASTAGASGAVPAPGASDAAKFLRGDGAWATPSSSGGGGVGEYAWAIGSTTIGSGSTSYLAYAIASVNSPESYRQWLAHAGTVTAMYVQTTGTQSSTGALTLTLRQNSADTAAAVTVAAGSTAGLYSVTGLSISLSDNDLLSVKVANAATATSAGIASIRVVVQ